MAYTMGSLFAGIGGFDLGFERAGFKTAWQVEIDPYCRKVLARHFPHTERYEDVRECGVRNLKRVDVICGGFPCQDISNAGLRAGIDGERSGLWGEFARIIGELRPSFIVVENVAALLGRGMGRVLGDLSALGYDAEWEVISAADVGAPHLRERVWIVAYPNGNGWQQGRNDHRKHDRAIATTGGEYSDTLAGPMRGRCWKEWARRSICAGKQLGQAEVANAGQSRLSQPERPALLGAWGGEEGGAITECSWWATEPDVGRVAHGIPARVDRLKGLGNAVVPQIPELIARQIMQALAASPEPESGQQ